MKKLIFIISFVCAIFISEIAYSQNVIWVRPSCQKSQSSGLSVQSVKFFSDATVVEFKYDNNIGQAGWVQLSRDCTIKAYPSGRTYDLVEAKGIPYAPNKHNFRTANETLSFTCIFPAVPNGTKSLDWTEEGSWVVTGIRSAAGTEVDNSKGSRYYSGSAPSASSSSQRNNSQGVDFNRYMKFNAYASSFCYPQGNGKWSDFSDWRDCEFSIEYNATIKQFIFNTARVQKFNVVNVSRPDPDVTDFECIDAADNQSCLIQFLTLPEEDVTCFYITFEDERICYMVEPEGVSGYASGNQQTSPSGSSYTSRKDRSEMASSIRGWGSCRLVAITQTAGDIAINGGNGYYSKGLPSKMKDDLTDIRDKKEAIQDISLTEGGEYVMIYGNNGVKFSDGIPYDMYNTLKLMNTNREKILSAVLNDDGDWIVISDKSFDASSDYLRDMMSDGIDKYGAIYSACLTNDSCIIVYEKGYRSYGEFPAAFEKAINATDINVYMIKLAGDSWFFADKEGHYQMSL